MSDLKAPVGLGVPSPRLSLIAVFDQDLGRFVPQAPEELSQLVRRHGQHVGLTRLVLAPADVLQEPEVFGELLSHSLDGGEVLGPLQRHPEVLDAAEVVADQLV
jgi:alpha-ketoglutarate-dependent taurine dioxygenase